MIPRARHLLKSAVAATFREFCFSPELRLLREPALRPFSLNDVILAKKDGNHPKGNEYRFVNCGRQRTGLNETLMDLNCGYVLTL